MIRAAIRSPLYAPAVSLETVEDAILPSVAMLLDALLDSAASARPGVDALLYADRLRVLAGDTGSLASGLDQRATG
jgi:hypothetical protein